MRKRVLIVEDDTTSATLVNFILKTNDFEVETAADGEEGLKKFGEFNPGLIILDVMMPKMDGYTFLRELKRNYPTQVPSVIMLTSKDHMEEVFRMEGVRDYLVKPLDSKEFLKKVEQCFC